MRKDINVEPSSVEPQGAREARFFWYYMTTTLTTQAFSTTTIDTTVSKYTFLLVKLMFVDYFSLI